MAIMTDEIKTFQDEVLDLIQENRDTYKVAPHRVLSDYRTEKGTTEAYNNRQILELLQNSDDAKSSIVQIRINTESRILTIANNGEPFNIGGIRSLMVARQSPKDKKEFIGNKGLGFRSILNWVDKVVVKTKAIDLIFSPEIAKREYDKIFKESEKFRNAVSEAKNLKGEIPFAVLAIPDFQDPSNTDSWETVFELSYKKEVEDSILKQLDDIKGEVLLFLRHLKRIEVIRDGNPPQSFEKEDRLDEVFINNDTQWSIFTSEQEFFGENKKFNFKIAWQKELENSENYFYTYLPMKVKTHLPSIIHATFDLDPARNQLNDSDGNIYILEVIADALGDLANTKIKSKDQSNWNSFCFLTSEGTSDNELLKPFYLKIKDYRDKLPIYPCVDGSYNEKGNVYYYGGAFSEWVEKNNFGIYFPSLLRSPFDKITKDFNHYQFKKYTPKEFQNIVKSISPLISSIGERVSLIRILLTPEFRSFHESVLHLPLLLDTNDNIVSEERQVFILSKKDVEQYYIPSFVKLSFISQKLYRSILNELADKIEIHRKNEKESDSRPLKRVVDTILNIGSNDINDVIKTIISETNQELKTVASMQQKAIAITDLMKSLYSIFKKNPTRTTVLSQKIPVINKEKEIKFCDELYLGNTYPSGKLTELIFDNVYEDSDYVADTDFWELGEASLEEKELFFLWIGVNKHIKIVVDETEKTRDGGYKNYLFSKITKPDKISYIYFKGLRLSRPDVIRKLSAEKLVLLVYKEPLLFQRLEYSNADELSYKYGNAYPKPFVEKPSYLEYQLVSNSNLNNYVLEEGGVGFDFKSFNFKHPILSNFILDEGKLRFILKKLGALETMDELSPQQYYSLFEKHEERYKDGLGTQAFYRKFLSYCAKNKDTLLKNYKHDFNGMKLFARKGGRRDGKLELKDVSEIYYFDNNLLPQNILDNYWILNLPKRAGEQNVKDFFGVNLIQKLLDEVELVKVSEQSWSQRFNLEMEELKALFLCYRLWSLKTKEATLKVREAINLIKSLEFRLVSECIYRFAKDEVYSLEDNSFIKIGNTYYVKNRNAIELSDLKKDREFCDAIAEIICINFKVKENKNDFRSVFKDSIEDSMHLIHMDELLGYFKSAREFLGVSRAELSFWERLYKFQGQKFPENIQNDAGLKLCIEEVLKYELPSWYSNVDFNDFNRGSGVDLLKDITSKYGIRADTLLDNVSTGLVSYHKNRFELSLVIYRSKFERLIWKKNSVELENQQLFLAKQIGYQDIGESIELNQFIEDNIFELNINYAGELVKIVKSLFKIDLDEEQELDEVTIKYSDLLGEHNLQEADIENLNIRSLLYFEGNEDIIKEHLKLICEKDITSVIDDNQTIEVAEINYSKSKKVISKTKKNGKGNGNAAWMHSSKNDKRKKKAGVKAEELVYNSLEANDDVEFVEWRSSYSKKVSLKSDSLHCDIIYKLKNEANLKYLEVKSFNGVSFHLSRSEMEEGRKRGEHYEIALVSNGEIHILKELFKKGVDFENNDFFKATPSDYIITLEIETE